MSLSEQASFRLLPTGPALTSLSEGLRPTLSSLCGFQCFSTAAEWTGTVDKGVTPASWPEFNPYGRRTTREERTSRLKSYPSDLHTCAMTCVHTHKINTKTDQESCIKGVMFCSMPKKLRLKHRMSMLESKLSPGFR